MQHPSTTNDAPALDHEQAQADTSDAEALRAILREELINPWGLPPEETPQ
ncbi:hypothetical protein [Aquabacterium sp.]|nr:hypothetical protein [Aquabacterium sp.]